MGSDAFLAWTMVQEEDRDALAGWTGYMSTQRRTLYGQILTESADDLQGLTQAFQAVAWKRVLRASAGLTEFRAPLDPRRLASVRLLREAVDVDPRVRGGMPVVTGTRFPVARVLAELGDGASLADVAENYDLEMDVLKSLLHGLALSIETGRVVIP